MSRTTLRIASDNRAPRPTKRGWAWRVALLGLCAAMIQGCGPPQQTKVPELDADPPPGADPTAGTASSELERGKAHIGEGRFAEAKPHIEKARELDPKNPEVLYYVGLVKAETGDAAGAEAAYRDAIKLDPKFVEAHQNLGALFLVDPPRPDEAIVVLNDALKIAPDNVRLMQNLAYAYSLKGDVAAASKQYEAALAKGDDLKLRFDYGSFLFEAKQFDKAAEQLKKVLEKAPDDDVKLLATLGLYLGQAKAFGDCVKAYDRALKIKPEAERFVRRGRCKHELGDKAGAKADYEGAVKTDPEFAPGHYYLGLALLDEKKRQSAIAAFEKAAKLGGTSPIGKLAKEKLDALMAQKK
jgi:tetratricopeptide (TPR) repeat protein